MAKAKKVIAIVKLQIPAGKATPAPPIGPALGQHGVNIMEFCKSYNAATASQVGLIVPVEITIFEDRSFTYKLKTPPTSVLITKALGIEKGASNVKSQKVGKISKEKIREIAEKKMPDLNATTIEAAMKMVAGTARSMGVDVE